MLNRFVLIFCFMTFGFSLNAQVTDKDKRNIIIPAVKSKKDKDDASTIKKTESLKLNDLIAKKLENDAKRNSSKKENKDTYFSLEYDDGLRNSGELFVERWNKQAIKQGIKPDISDQFVGEYPIDSKFVNIVCRDHGAIDGDRVSVSLNGEIVYRSVTLQYQYRRLNINLVDGLNIIEIKALNQGNLGANTADFIIADDQQNVIKESQWWLYTGGKIIVKFINEKPTITAKNEGN